MAKPLWIPDDQFDDVQREIYDIGFGVEERNCIVQGCAGSGKSCIAMNMFVNLCARGNRKPVIVTNQRTLINAYLRELRSLSGLKASEYVKEAQNGEPASWYSKNRAINTYEKGFRKEFFPSDATDLFVDEAQDFSLQEIKDMISYFGGNLKAVHFFGDDGQQIYEGVGNGAHRISMKDLVEIASSVGGRSPFCRVLFDNYRLPPVVAKFVDEVEPYSRLAQKCHGEGTEPTRLISFPSVESALQTVADVLKVRMASTDNYLAAVVCQSRRRCEEIYGALSKMSAGRVMRVRGPLSDKWATYQDPDGPKTLESLTGINLVVTTAFASKGLQYDDVFVITEDFNAKKWTENILRQLHVALTRTQGGLIVCYTPYENMGEPPQPFVRVNESNFKNTL